jgi:hypothetical protein
MAGGRREAAILRIIQFSITNFPLDNEGRIHYFAQNFKLRLDPNLLV